MNDEMLFAKASEHAESQTGHPFERDVESAERFSTVQEFGTYNGHAIRIDFTNSEGQDAYRFNATVYDAETGEAIATGNGASSWSEAFGIVHWRELGIRWP